MAQPEDLMNRGVAPALALDLGYKAVTITGAGTTVAAATLIQPDNHLVIMTTTTAGAASVRLSSEAPLGTMIWICNSTGSGVTGNVFPSTNGIINAGATSAAVTLTTGVSALFIQTTAGYLALNPVSANVICLLHFCRLWMP